MSEKQMDFLDELASLLSKYGIDDMSAGNGGDNGRIDFVSCGQTLSIGYFAKGRFERVRNFYGCYKPQEQEVKQ